MAVSTQTIGFASAILGGGMTAVRTALKRGFNYEFPVWVDQILGIGGLALIAVAALSLWSAFLAFIGEPLPKDTAWPGTILYAAITGALIFASGYLPANIAAFSPIYKKTWDKPILENVINNLDYYNNKGVPRSKVKVIATEQGKDVAEVFVKFLLKFEWEVEVNHEDGSYIFPPKMPFRGVILRYRENSFNIGSPIFTALNDTIYTPDTVYFPSADAFDFVQVEIGYIPDSYYGWN